MADSTTGNGQRPRRRRPSSSDQQVKPASRWQQGEPNWRQVLVGWLASFGITSSFRAYFFIGGIVAVLVFLVYNQYLIEEFKDAEERRVELYTDLYASATSGSVSAECAALLYDKIIDNPNNEFSLIFTDDKGQITAWKGRDLPGRDDTSPRALEALRQRVGEMDAIHAPVTYVYSVQPYARLHYDQDHFILTDNRGQIVAWQGWDLPARGDTSAAAQARLQQIMVRMDAVHDPRIFEVPARQQHFLHFDGLNYIVANEREEIVVWWGDDLPAMGATDSQIAVEQAMLRMDMENNPVSFVIDAESPPQYIHYGDSDLVSGMTMAPFVQIGVLSLFVLLGYLGFSNMKRSQQRSIWVGMSRETAHQLGTPLSSLAGWIELIEDDLHNATADNAREKLARIGQKIHEMGRDTQRLHQIASRFSQIGSVPDLQIADAQEVLRETILYFERRGSQFGRHQVDILAQDVPPVPLNAELMGWVFENLFKNAVDAIGSQAGRIEIRIELAEDGRWVLIAFADNGCGMALEDTNRVFEPGFSTKTRGWGLGLSFVKRIVEEYHRGRIRVARSVQGEGTTMEIKLPVA